MNIGMRIKARRKELRISVDELAKRLGKDRSTVYRYEKGDIENLPLDILEPIAAALNTTPAYLMGWDDVGDEKPADNDGLSENMQKLVDFAKSVPEDKAAMILRVIQSIVGDDSDSSSSATKSGK